MGLSKPYSCCGILAGSILLGVTAGCRGDSVNDSAKPNIIFILADDLGWKQTGAYGSDYYATPGMDRLAQNGIRFTRAYSAAAVCSPTRASIMTGKYPARLHLTDFIKGNSRTTYPLQQPEWTAFLPLEEMTMGEYFHQAGYANGFFGKWHLSKDKFPPGSLSHNPDKQGFPEYFITYKPDASTDPGGDPHNSDSITNAGIRFIRTHRKDPFLLFLSYNAIHDPLTESKSSITRWQARTDYGNTRQNPVTAAMLQRMDEGVRKITALVDDLDLTDRTIILFYSDNGGKESHADQAFLKKGKGWLYEGGIRVPLVISWPNHLEKGLTINTPVISNDLLPTLLELASIDYEACSMDGKSFAGLLLEGKSRETGPLFWHYPHYHYGTGMKPAGAILKDNFKLIQWYEALILKDSLDLELYDLETDPGEERNLADSLPGIRDQFLGLLQSWRKETGARMPVKNPQYEK